MKLPASIVAFCTTWGAMFLLFGLQAIYSAATMREPDMKFGESAPYIGLALFGGIGGFIAGFSALAATFVFEQERKTSLSFTRTAGTSVLAALPFAFMAWYAAVWSPLPVAGTVAVLFGVCTLLFLTLLYATQRQPADA